MIPDSPIQEIKARLTIQEAIEHFGGKVRAWRERPFKINCFLPGHDDRNPSMTIYPREDRAWCYGCWRGGDVIDITEICGNMDTGGAVRYWAARLNIPLRGDFNIRPRRSRPQKRPPEKEATLQEARSWALDFFLQALEGSPGMDYLRARGYGDDEIRRMGLGYFPSVSQLIQALPENLREPIKEAGLTWSKLEGRIAIPYWDPGGTLKGFAFRATSPDTPEGEKYLVSPGTRKDTFFNLNRWEGGPLVVVEGYLDALAAWARGVPGVVAATQANITREQIEDALALGAEEFILALDDDEAGHRGMIKAAEEIYDLARERGTAVKVRFISGYGGAKDPDELMRKEGSEAFRKAIGEAEDAALMALARKGISPYCLVDLEEDLIKVPPGLKTGFPSLDRYITIPPEALTVVAGRPGHGKTTFLMNLALNLAEAYDDKAFLYFSYEESRRQIGMKMICILGEAVLDPRNPGSNLLQLENYLRGGNQGNERVERGKERFHGLTASGRLWIVDEPFTVENLAAVLDLFSRIRPIGAVLVDYIQKVKVGGSFPTRYQEIQRASARLLETAIDLSVPVIVAAQFGRDDKGDRAAVRLDNLREAGDIEQDANLVLGLYDAAMDGKEEEAGDEIRVTVLKNRNGEAGAEVLLAYDRATRRIRERERPRF